jgi:DNA-binding NarL/FixJ family response regulator
METALHRRVPAVFVVDRLELRRAAIASFLKPWADQCGIRVVAVGPAEITAVDGLLVKMIIVVVGTRSVAEARPFDWISAFGPVGCDAPIAVLSERDDPEEVVAAFKGGARGLVPMSAAPSVALPALSFIMSGGSFFPPMTLTSTPRIASTPPVAPSVPTKLPETALTMRQREVLERIRQGQSNKLIGRQLKLRESTVKVHVRQIMRKLGVHNRTQAALYAGELIPSTLSPPIQWTWTGQRISAGDSRPLLPPSPGCRRSGG